MTVRGSYSGILFVVTTALVTAIVFDAGNEHRRLTWDDGYILMSGARTLIEHGSLALTPDRPPLIGITSPGYVLALSIPGMFMPLEAASRLIGLVSFLTATFLFYLILSYYRDFPVWSVLCATLLFVVSGHMVFLVWTGMETMLYVAALLGFILCYQRLGLHYLSGVIAGVLFWIRPDGLALPFVLGCLGIVRAFRGEAEWRRVIEYALASLLICCPYVVWNYAYNGVVIPNTIFAKANYFAMLCEEPWKRVLIGLFGLLVYVWTGALVWILALAGLRRPGPLLALRLPALFAGMLISAPFFIALPDGFTTYEGRYAAPLFVLVSLFVAPGLLSLLRFANNVHPRLRWPAHIVGMVALLWFVFDWTAAEWIRLHKKHIAAATFHEALYQQVQKIRSESEEGSVLAVTDLGVLMFYSDRPVIDMVGLADADMTSHYTDENGGCLPPTERDLLPALVAHDVDYLVIAEDWDRKYMGHLLADERLKITRLPSPGYPLHRVDDYSYIGAN